MSLLHSLFFGIGMLILVYLAVKNSDGVTKIFKSTSGGINTVASTLQGN